MTVVVGFALRAARRCVCRDNFDPKTKRQRQIYCFAISAKRYVLFLYDESGAPVLLRKDANNKENQWSEHGLGHLLNPIDPENRDWISHVWLNIIRKALKLPTERLDFEDLPAVGRVSVGSPGALRPLANLNIGKKYRDQIKPFNFLLTCHVKPLGHPIDADPERFHLIAPYQSNPRKWLGMQWIDQYSSRRFRIVTTGYPNERTALVKTYNDVLGEYEFHPESKCADADGNACGKQTVGLLQRLCVRIQKFTYIGKESNKIEDVASALIHSAQEVYTEYPDPRRDEWESTIRPALNKVPVEDVAKMTGRSRRTIIYWRTGRRRPHPKNQERIAEVDQLLTRIV